MATLPFLLAGPIVRRVDANHAAFWVALSSQASVTAHVWSGQQTSTGAGTVASGDAEQAHGKTSTRKFGEHLHVAVVVAEANTVLPPGQLFSYDLSFSVGGRGLGDLGLLRNEVSGDRAASGVDAAAPMHLALGYVLDRLPSFVTPPAALADLVLAQGSCRKTNGDGPDAMAFLDDLIEDNFSDPLQRPHQLFLTGDQIYADEVGTALLPTLTALGKDLLGYVERIPIGANDVDATQAQLPATRRQRLVREMAGFSTTAGSNHLMSFGEYAAMYLCVWSPRVWRALATHAEVFVANPHIEANHLTDWEACFPDPGPAKQWPAAKKKAFDEETVLIEAFRASVPRVARMLANTPTYMIFDDHEVTDDWYLSQAWRRRVLTAPLGRAIIRNALGAYTVFQGWGNEPSAFTHISTGATSENEKLLDAVAGMVEDGPALSSAIRNQLDTSLGLTDPVTAPKATFHYSVPSAMHMVRVLDTRTRRSYAAGGDSPPRLVGSSLDAQLPAGPLADGRELLLVISPAPVLLPRVLDTVVQPMVASSFDLSHHITGKEEVSPCQDGPLITGSEDADAEGWRSDEKHLEEFLRRAGTYTRVLIFSGDVHFSSSLQLDFWTKDSDTVASRIVQFTSSSLRNPPEKARQAVLRALRFGQQGLQGVPFSRLGWSEKSSIQVPSGKSIRPGRRARLMRSPSLNRADGWPAGTSIPSGKPPDWRWTLRVLRDERNRSEMQAVPLPPPPQLPAFDAADPIASYHAIAAKHMEAATADATPLRLMVFATNVSVVRFATVGNELEARHLILSPDAPAATTGAAYTEHRASLSISAALNPPQLQTV